MILLNVEFSQEIFCRTVPDFLSVVFSVDFKEALGMITGWTNIRCFRTDYDMSAVTALPDLDFALFKYSGSFHGL